jgi:hypothetical protein
VEYSTILRILSTLLSIFASDKPITKRQLGSTLAVIGAVGIVGVLAIDLLQIGRQGGIGPAQAFALFILALMLIIGLTLIPLGDAPA